MNGPRWLRPGIAAALAASVLFGLSTPLAKLLLAGLSPWMLAGLLYLGSGVVLAGWRLVRGQRGRRLAHGEVWPLVGAIGAGGILAPVLLMVGLAGMPASGASLLLNAEAVLTVAIAWLVFGEHVNRRTLFGFGLIVAGVVVLGWQGQATFGGWWSTLALVGACLGWAVDNNLTRAVTSVDATWLAMVKGLVAGPVNLAVAFLVGGARPGPSVVLGAMSLGAICYGLSLALFIVGLRALGTARAGAYFSTAPFFGGLLAVVLGEPVTVPLLLAAALMATGVWLHLSEHHSHEHMHAAVSHDHWHIHDDHHQHAHEHPVDPGRGHRHPHAHERLTHGHEHFPDTHHRHGH
ncbi:MAG TPA: EamA family transporter [Propionicimonas sp.]|uniref:DMT family transporter n=1 Tax=Propionicimonas sp. TaxID=1955623 RepID=UPI002F42642B